MVVSNRETELGKEKFDVEVNNGPIIDPRWVRAIIIDERLRGTKLQQFLARISFSLHVQLEDGQKVRVGKGRIRELRE